MMVLQWFDYSSCLSKPCIQNSSSNMSFYMKSTCCITDVEMLRVQYHGQSGVSMMVTFENGCPIQSVI